jgi:glutathione S-transferase
MTTEPFESLNPNGRVPAITDPNTNLTLWESGAIIEYLLATYDPSQTLSYPSSPNKYLTQSWLHFQTSGQGPYFGQRAWFIFYHPEKNLNSVLDRYGNEIWRVTGVIDAHLKKTGGQWLVGDKCTYADLSFVPWYWLCPAIMGDGFEKVSYPC